ncbi:Bax inhibitor-1 family protein [Mammaliicoccus sciuri]|uniref:Bax inhibitor-1/YccA family protein n=1 Tax=Mammaliicoccus sciuri TaxID=1296 RepID=UPI001E298910|nr:Bax inhibitor-1 family protein [Mammaliicoccus sciuri]MCD8897563.1 Bax inhibitor-1 family protein [Mammaliicoccus sciuri]
MNYDNQYASYQQTDTHGSAIRKTWLYFLYYWIIFGVGTYVGQFVPPALHLPITIGLFVLIMISLFVKSSRKFGGLISNIYAFFIGVISYTAFMYYLGALGTQAFYGNITLAIGAFAAFGILGYFMIDDASGLGKYLFVTLIALIFASLLGIFIHNPIFHTVLSVIGIGLFLLYTVYDFNRMKLGNFSPREMGFNLFINLLNIIMHILRLASILKD